MVYGLWLEGGREKFKITCILTRYITSKVKSSRPYPGF